MDAAVCALFLDNDMLLVRSRRTPSHWQPPGGLIEATDESAADAAVREVREELALDVPVDSLLLAAREPSDFGQGVIYCFTARFPADQEVVASPREVLEVRWISPETALRGLAMHAATRSFLTRLIEFPDDTGGSGA